MFQSLFARQRESRISLPDISPQEAAQRMESSRPPLLIDVRTPQEFQNDGHIQGARLLPLASLPLRMDEVPQDQPIVLVCRSGARSRVAGERLVAAGYDEVFNLQGGMMRWRQAGLPVRH